jgi:hypothetical protein
MRWELSIILVSLEPNTESEKQWWLNLCVLNSMRRKMMAMQEGFREAVMANSSSKCYLLPASL